MLSATTQSCFPTHERRRILLLSGRAQQNMNKLLGPRPVSGTDDRVDQDVPRKRPTDQNFIATPSSRSPPALPARVACPLSSRRRASASQGSRRTKSTTPTKPARPPPQRLLQGCRSQPRAPPPPESSLKPWCPLALSSAFPPLPLSLAAPSPPAPAPLAFSLALRPAPLQHARRPCGPRRLQSNTTTSEAPAG